MAQNGKVLDNFYLAQTNRIINVLSGRGRQQLDSRWKNIISRKTNSSSSAPPKYILLNDTAILTSNVHSGCSSVTGLIHAELQSIGLTCLASVNSVEEIEDKIYSLEDVALVIMNGEGSVHHDNSRITGLMDFAKLAKDADITTALINSVWQHNSSVMAKYLQYFDIVTVRERRSYEAIKSWHNDVRVVPDLSIKAFSKSLAARSSDGQADQNKYPYVVIDSTKLGVTKKLREFALAQSAPMYYMGFKHWRSLEASEKLIKVGSGYVPKLLESINDLELAKACLTGRFHGAVAGLCAGMPVFALSSNTHKTESMLEDIGIEDVALVDRQWLSYDAQSQRRKLDIRLEKWDAHHRKLVTEYISKACLQIEELFSSVSKLVSQA